MNWKLIFKLFFLLFLFSFLILITLSLLGALFGSSKRFWIISILLVIAVMLCAMVFSGVVIGKKVRYRRFFHGVLLGAFGWSFAFFAAGFLVSFITPVFDVPQDVTDGVMYLLGGFWFFGVLTSPLFGFSSNLAGRKYDRKELEQGTTINSEVKQHKKVDMNWRLIFALSIFGLAMGIASVLGIVSHSLELYYWLLIAMICAVVIVKKTATQRFLHGFFTGLIGGISAPILAAIFFSTYLANNPSYADTFKELPGNMGHIFYQLIIALFAVPAYGLLLGCFAYLAGKIFKKQVTVSTTN